MKMASRRFFALSAVLFALTSAANPVAAQNEREGLTPSEGTFSHQFFTELRRIFGEFRYVNLERVFNTARPVQCSALVSTTGEWREVAFFNEHRDFGNWYRTSLEEVKKDPSVYAFKGSCKEQRSPVQLNTRFPVDQSFKDQDKKIDLGSVEIIVNPPVSAHFNSQSGAYAFDLPYLFRVSEKDANPLYALSPKTSADRYAPGVSNHWECKSVDGVNVTYQFLICHTTLVQNEASNENHRGTSAFSILSDGEEASSSVTLTFQHEVDPKPHSVETPPAQTGFGFRDSHRLRTDK
jgi:hypothetical protein